MVRSAVRASASGNYKLAVMCASEVEENRVPCKNHP